MAVGARGLTAVICAIFDPEGEDAVCGLVTRLAKAGVPAADPSRHPPHVTLGAATVPLDGFADLQDRVGELAGGEASFRLALDRVGTFTDAGVLWLGPAPSPALSGLQRRLDAMLAAAGHQRAFGIRSQPGTWVPHCTLATGLTTAELALATLVVTPEALPVRARVESLLTIVLGRDRAGGIGDRAVALTGRAAAGSG